MRYWPGLILGLILIVYWGRVIRLTIKARRRSGRAGNFIPTEPVGRWLRIIWNPVVAAWIALPIISTFRDSRLPPPLHRYPLPPPIIWIAIAVALLALIATFICWRKMGSSWRMGIDPHEKTRLILGGPYAYVRHPIYALSSLLMLMSMVVISSPLMLVIGFVHLFLLQWEARREEKYLTILHGDLYRTYIARTGRFVPRSLRPYKPQSGIEA